MKTSKKQIFKGYWKLPSDEKYNISGHLTFNPSTGGLLEVMGTFGNQDERTLEEYHPIIHGFTTNGMKLTLLGCHGIGSTNLPGISTLEVFVKTILIGSVHFEEVSDLVFHGANCHFLGLDEWVGIDGFNRQGTEEELSKISYQQPEKINLWNSDQEKIFLWFHRRGPKLQFFSKKRQIKQQILFGLEFYEDRNLEQILQRISMLRNFISFALADTTFITKITLISKQATNKAKFFQVLMPTNEFNINARSFSNHQNMLFSFSDIKENYTDIFKSWFDLYEKLRPVIELYFQSINNVYLGGENYFLNLMFALETYHRRTSSELKFDKTDYQTLSDALRHTVKELSNKKYADWLESALRYGNELSLRKRLTNILNTTHAELIVRIGDTERFISKILDTRNFLVHYDAPLESRAIKSNKFPSYNLKLKILLQICILKELGFNDKQVGEFIVRTTSFWNV